MTGSQILDAVERSFLSSSRSRVSAPERDILLDELNDGISEIISITDWDWAQVVLRPTIGLQQGKREYQLPPNFGDNFVRYAFHDGTKWACKMIDQTNLTEQFLDYLSPVQFYNRKVVTTTQGVPRYYTILSLPSGMRQMVLDQPPDSTYADWVIGGNYVPTDWLLEEEGLLPPLPGNSAVLKYWLLKRVFSWPEYKDLQLLQFYSSEYDKKYAELVTLAQRQRKGQIVPGELIQDNYSQLDRGGF